ncbi:unnamed protein product [Prorocentrum cordatum]|uniref:Uncharacterized protein n=1 Tax=Prorocentrum cordatum TaxID=2364126 RepID=A0ABN9SSK7_9DINO|nr:unnamed protein product [Polarella glacialis]
MPIPTFETPPKFPLPSGMRPSNPEGNGLYPHLGGSQSASEAQATPLGMGIGETILSCPRQERASTLVKALASMHRYVEGGQAPWCVATSSGVLVAVHMLRAGGRLKIVDTPGPAPLREAE